MDGRLINDRFRDAVSLKRTPRGEHLCYTLAMNRQTPSHEIAALIHLVDQAYDRRAWHGPNLRGSLRGLDARQAAWRPARGRHNIWELALHCAYWKYCVRRLLLGEKRGNFPLKGSNFWERPEKGSAASEGEWKKTLQLVEEQHRRLRAAVARFPAARLHRTANPRGWTFSQTIMGIASHDLYHAGQIRLLRRLQGK